MSFADQYYAKRRRAEQKVERTPRRTLKAAYELYERSPIKAIRSDDAYSQWEDTLRWDELSPETQLEYIQKVESIHEDS